MGVCSVKKFTIEIRNNQNTKMIRRKGYTIGKMLLLSFSYNSKKFVKRDDFIPQSYYKLVTRCTGLVIKGAGIEVRNTR